MKLTLLLLGANPIDTSRLRIDKEMSAIDHALRAAGSRDQFDLILLSDVSGGDLQEPLLHHRPQIVHFSGHGTGKSGIVLQNAAGLAQLVPTSALADLFALANTTVRCVVLNACYSVEQAKAIAEYVDCVIGLPDTIDDTAALAFSTAFYSALGHGETIARAFRFACNALDLQTLDDVQKPQLLGRADPTQVSLLKSQPRFAFLLRLPQRFRRRSVILGALPLILFLGWVAIQQLWKPPLCPADQVCILVAHLATPANPSPAVLNLAEEIEQTLAQEIYTVLNDTTTHVQFTGPVENASVAEMLARQHGAQLVIWGKIITSENNAIQVHFRLTDRLGLADGQTVRPFRIQPIHNSAADVPIECHADEECLQISGAVTQRVRFITHFVAGLAQYVQEQPAANNFLAALHCLGALPPTSPLLPGINLTCVEGVQTSTLNLNLVKYYAGRALITQGNYAAAEGLLLKVAESNEADPAALIALSILYRNWLQDEDAPLRMTALQKAQKRIEALPFNNFDAQGRTALLYSKGLIAELQRDYALAQQYYQDALDSYPKQDDSAYTMLVNLGRVQRLAGAIADATATLKSAIKLIPKLPWAYLELAQLSSKEQVVAEKYLQNASSSAPAEPWVDIMWARLCRSWEDVACAATHYKQAISLRSDWSWLRSYVGDFYRSTNPINWTQAEVNYQRAVELSPCDPWTHQRLAYVLAAGPQVDYRKAAYHYQQTLLLLHAETKAEIVETIENGLQQALIRGDAPVDLPTETPAFCK